MKGHLLASKKGAEISVSGGISLDKVNQYEDNTYFVGTESGSVYKCAIAWPNEQDVSHLFEEKSQLRWK